MGETIEVIGVVPLLSRLWDTLLPSRVTLRLGCLNDLLNLSSLLFGVLGTSGLLRVLFRLPFRLGFLDLAKLVVAEVGIIFFKTFDRIFLLFPFPESFNDLLRMIESRSVKPVLAVFLLQCTPHF